MSAYDYCIYYGETSNVFFCVKESKFFSYLGIAIVDDLNTNLLQFELICIFYELFVFRIFLN